MPLTRPIDYTNLDFASLREAMLELARESLPEWTDQTENDLGVLLLELFAYAGDIALYYQTRIAANLLPATSDEPDALVQLLRLIGYEIAPPTSASATLELAFDAAEPTPVVIPERSQFFASNAAGEQLVFETLAPLEIAAAQLGPPDVQGLRHTLLPVPVVEGRTVAAEVLAEADGSPNQLYRLGARPVLAGSVEIEVDEPGGTTRWREVESLASSTPADRHYTTRRDATDAAAVLFGDGLNGMIPPRGPVMSPVTVRAGYRVGGGARGNLPSGADLRPALGNIVRATAVAGAAGGRDAESLERARDLAPRLFRSQNRAVTARDFADLALRVPGVGKARAAAADWNRVLLWVAPSGRVDEPSELVRREVLAFFESRRMASVELEVLGPEVVDVYLGATVRAEPYFLRSEVRRAVEESVAALFAFDTVRFGEPIFLSRIYDAIQSLPQVASLNITELSRVPDATVASEGVIELRPSELPRPGYRDNPLTPAPPSADHGASPTSPLVLELIGGKP